MSKVNIQTLGWVGIGKGRVLCSASHLIFSLANISLGSDSISTGPQNKWGGEDALESSRLIELFVYGNQRSLHSISTNKCIIIVNVVRKLEHFILWLTGCLGIGLDLSKIQIGKREAEEVASRNC